MPVEVSLTIVCAGFVGLVLPGPFGAPLIVGGGLSLWPRAFRPIDRWVERRMPAAHTSGTKWLIRFQTDLERRYPANRTDGMTNGFGIESTWDENGASNHGR
jgi:hypothetical protein